MSGEILSKLGYNLSTRLSQIEEVEKTFKALEDKFFKKESTNIFSDLKDRLQKVQKILQKDERMPNFENLYLRGYNYSKSQLDLTVKEIWTDILATSKNEKYITELYDELKEAKEDEDKKLSLRKKINSLFVKICVGFSLFKFIQFANEVLLVIEKNQIYFEHEHATRELSHDFFGDLKLLKGLNEFNYNATTIISNVEKENKLIEGMKKEFTSINTPDIKRTIKDRIDNINNQLNEDKSAYSQTHEESNLYYQGYLMAIRGQDPTVLDILKKNLNYIYRRFYNDIFLDNTDFGEDINRNIQDVLTMTSKGYAYSYHIKYLENELRQPLSRKITHKEKANNTNSLIKLNWLGQKNQLYDVLRQLKAKEWLGNSYEDLAVFLKQNVVIFQNTSLSTIQKEIGKDKRPPKNKRLNLE